jgi:aspartyl-tRNA(Asn)/glutamyl-tRNA(Gln) amidotransferase subunit C
MSTPLSRAEVVRIAELARLELTDNEVTLFAKQLGGILEYAEMIQAVDTSGVPPATHAGDQPSFRDDVVTPGLSTSDALGNAPQADSASGTFVVPKVIG